MNNVFSINKSDWVSESDQFTEHMFYNLMKGSTAVARIKVTRFDWRSASFLNTHKSWVCRNGTVIDKSRNYIFEKKSNTIKLSDTIGQFLYSKDPMLFIDNVEVDSNYCSMTIISQMIEGIISDFVGLSVSLLIPEWKKIGDIINLEESMTISFFYNLGLVSLDENMMFRYMDTPHIKDNNESSSDISNISKMIN